MTIAASHKAHVHKAYTEMAITILRDARKLIERPENWARGDYAFDRHGALCAPTDPNAVCWCLLGAVECAAKRFSHARCDSVTEFLGEICDPKYECCGDFNDHEDTTHADVIAFLDGAIELLQTANE